MKISTLRWAALLGVIVLSAAGAVAQEAEPAEDQPAPSEAAELPPAQEPASESEPAEVSGPVGDLLVRLGRARPDHWVEPTDELVERGRQLLFEGRSSDPEGRKGKVLSGAFVCTDCHNMVREDPDLRVSDPVARLDYAVEHDLPFLPGTTLWGAVNRSQWFNDDYDKKYGDLVDTARGAYREATILCTSECSQGRIPEDWELEAMLAWQWTQQIDASDLDLSDEDRHTIGLALAGHGDAEAAAQLLESYWLAGSPAHAGAPPADTSKGYGAGGDADSGGQIYRRSCLHCHDKGGPGTYRFFDDKASASKLLRNLNKQNNLSMYRPIRYGTRPFGVPLAYMPFYTHERLSDAQVDDLRAFLEAQAGGGK